MNDRRSTRSWLRRSRALVFAIVIGAGSMLAGCTNELYSNLNEKEADQMMAILMANSIATQKTSDKNGFTLSVDEGDMLRAIAVLDDAGYQKSKHETIGEIFKQSGIMSSPFEERVRYIYALGQDLAETLSHIDGVVTARVQIVLPQAPELGQPVKPSSAAVFIKHEPGVDLDYFVPQIKRLVSSSIEGLDYSAVTVVLADATPMKQTPIAAKRGTVEVAPGISIRDGDQLRFWELAIGGIALVFFLLVSNIVILVAWRGKKLFSRGRGANSVPVIEPS